MYAMSSEEVKKAKASLAAARSALKAARGRGEWATDDAALEAVMAAERDLARAEGRAYAVLEPCALTWAMGAPLPTLIQKDYRAFLLFWLSDDGLGQVELEGCAATSFGSPDENEIVEHPLYGSGLDPCRLTRVINSP